MCDLGLLDLRHAELEREPQSLLIWGPFEPLRTGAALQTSEIARGFAENGWDVRVLSFRGCECPQDVPIQLDQLPIDYLHQVAQPHGYWAQLSRLARPYLESARSERRTLLLAKESLVWPLEIACPGLIESAIVLLTGSPAWEATTGQLKESETTRLIDLWRRAAQTIVGSRHMLGAIGPNLANVVVHKFGIDLRPLMLVPRRARSQDKHRFVHVSNGLELKRTARVLELFATCHGRIPGSELLVVGRHGVARGDGVQCVGCVPPPELYALMRSATALIVMSAYEVGPRVAYEAMALECPVIAGHGLGLDELQVTQGPCTLQIDMRDANALTRAIAMLNNPQYCEELQRRASSLLRQRNLRTTLAVLARSIRTLAQ